MILLDLTCVKKKDYEDFWFHILNSPPGGRLFFRDWSSPELEISYEVKISQRCLKIGGMFGHYSHRFNDFVNLVKFVKRDSDYIRWEGA